MTNNNKRRIILFVKYSIFLVMLIVPISYMIGLYLYFQHVDDKYRELINTGIHTNATINNYIFRHEDDGIEYYSLKYVFEDENSVQHNGETSKHYTLEEAKALVEEHAQIEITYNPTTFESIEASYDINNNSVSWMFLAFASIWLIAGIVYVVSNALKGKKEDINIFYAIEDFI